MFQLVWNNLKAKLDDLDFGKLETVYAELKKINDVADNEVSKNAQANTLKTKVNNFIKASSWCNYFNSHKSRQHR